MPADRVVVLVPGMGYTVQAPLLAYIWLAARRREAEVRPMQWSPPPIEDSPSGIAWVGDQVAAVLADAHALVVGKSLGSMAAGLVAERGLPAVWLTPLLDRPQVVQDIRAAQVPPLLIGGTADPTWNGATAHTLSPHVLEIPEADHSLQTPGPALATVQVAEQVVTAVEAFLDQEIWPN